MWVIRKPLSLMVESDGNLRDTFKRDVSRTQSNIYDGACENMNLFFHKSSIADDRVGSKCVSAQFVRVDISENNVHCFLKINNKKQERLHFPGLS